jgi:urea transporter
MPVLTSTFVIVTWLMLIGSHVFKALEPVAPADTTMPEGNMATADIQRPYPDEKIA